MEFSQEHADLIHWWHTMRLPNGVVTKGHHDPSSFFGNLCLPERLDGLTAADVGAWDGAFSFELHRRGAQVTAIDEHVWKDLSTGIAHGSPTGKQGFDFANGALGFPVRGVWCDVLDLKYLELREMTEMKFDIVLFLGVLYHMRHPLLALENVAHITKPGGLCVIETHLDAQSEAYPTMKFYEGRELGNDPTNWWGPNPACVCAMARAAGFASCSIVSNTATTRAVFHARKAA